MPSNPSAANPACRSATVAIDSVATDALTTMTTLVQTRISAAQKRILSDFSVRAIDRSLPAASCPSKETNQEALNSHQPDRTRTPASQAGSACVPSGRLLAAASDLMTVERSFY
jgi:hypothetical protein